MSVIVSVKMTATPGREQAAHDALVALTPVARGFEGCVYFHPHVDTENPGVLLVVEEWSSPETLQAWVESAVFQELAVGTLMSAVADVERIELALIA